MVKDKREYKNLTAVEKRVLNTLHNKKYKDLKVCEIEEIQRLYSKNADPENKILHWAKSSSVWVKSIYKKSVSKAIRKE
jgi:hypothetical protein